MGEAYKKVKNYLVTQAKKETISAGVLTLIYRILINEIVEAFVTILFPIFIGIIAPEKGKTFSFWAIIIIYIVLIMLMALAKNHHKNRIKEYKMLNQACYGINATLYKWADELQKCAKKIFNLGEKNKDNIRNETVSINSQNAAFVVCKYLRDALTKYCENDNVYITVFQREKTPTDDICRMIAYSGECEPSTYGEEYEVPTAVDNMYGKIPYHSYLFASEKTDISVLPDPESVEKAFLYHKKAKEREQMIKQYIAIPISPADVGVTFILQVDTTVEQLFGKDKDEVMLFAKTAIYPFAQFLLMSYEQSRAVQQIMGSII